MTTRTTITIDDKVKKEAQSYCEEKGIRGGLSGFIETLIKQHFEREAINESLKSRDNTGIPYGGLKGGHIIDPHDY